MSQSDPKKIPFTPLRILQVNSLLHNAGEHIAHVKRGQPSERDLRKIGFCPCLRSHFNIACFRPLLAVEKACAKTAVTVPAGRLC